MRFLTISATTDLKKIGIIHKILPTSEVLDLPNRRSSFLKIPVDGQARKDRQEMAEGNEPFFGLASSGLSVPSSSAKGNTSASRSGFKASEAPSGEFAFSSDDVLPSYDYGNKQSFSDGHLAASARSSNSSSEGFMTGSLPGTLREHRIGKPYATEQRQEDEAHYREVVATVERTMKKYADNLLRVLDGMSGRLLQLELVNQRLERSVGEMRADVAHNQSSTDERFRLLENQMREIHRAVQILRDKQEIAEAQTELVKLQLTHKESSGTMHGSEDKPLTSTSMSEGKQGQSLQLQNVQLQHRPLVSLPALPAPEHLMPPHSLPAPSSDHCQSSLVQQPQPVQANLVQQSPAASLPQQQQQPPHIMPVQPYYQQHPQQQQRQVQQVAQASQPLQVPHIQQPPQQQQSSQAPQVAYMHQLPQIQSMPTQNAQPQHLHQAQLQQLSHSQPPMQLQPSQQPHLSQQPQTRSHIYSAPQQAQLQPHQGPQGQSHSLTPEVFSYTPESQNQSSQVLYQGVSSSGNPSEASVYAYGSHGRIIQSSAQGQLTMQPPRPQLNQGGSQITDGSSAGSASVPPSFAYGPSAYNLPPRPPSSAYGAPFSGVQQMSSFPGSYRFAPPQQVQQFLHPSGNVVATSSGGHLPSSHSHDELVEQVVAMGFARDQVRALVQRLNETGQPVDMNSVLDRLNGTAGAPSQRWLA